MKETGKRVRAKEAAGPSISNSELKSIAHIPVGHSQGSLWVSTASQERCLRNSFHPLCCEGSVCPDQSPGTFALTPQLLVMCRVVHNRKHEPSQSFSQPSFSFPVICSCTTSLLDRSSVNLYLVPKKYPLLPSSSGQLSSAFLLIVSRFELWRCRLPWNLVFHTHKQGLRNTTKSFPNHTSSLIVKMRSLSFYGMVHIAKSF